MEAPTPTCEPYPTDVSGEEWEFVAPYLTFDPARVVGCEKGDDVGHVVGPAQAIERGHPLETKEELVLVDQIDQLIAERIAAGPGDDSLVHRIGRAPIEAARVVTELNDSGDFTDREFLLARLRLMISTPALRARHLDNQYATQKAIVDAVLVDDRDPEAEFRAWAAAGACMAVLHVALTRWAREDGHSGLPDMVATALAAAFDGVGFRSQ